MSQVGYRGKTTNNTRDVVGTQAEMERESQWGDMPAKVVSFDAKAGTVDVQPLFKPKHNGTAITMPVLKKVPLNVPRAGNGALTWPIQVGDRLMLRPQGKTSDGYHSEDKGDQVDSRSFSLADMEAYVSGGNSLKDPIKNYDPDNIHFRADEEGNYGIKMNKDGKVNIKGSQGDIYDLLAQVVELLAADTLVIKYGSSAGSGHELEHRAKYAEIAGKLRSMHLEA